MPKPLYGVNGSGMHCNLSLFKNGENVFYDQNGDLQLSDDARHFIAGILKHAPAFTAVANPTVKFLQAFSTWIRSSLLRSMVCTKP